LKKNKKSKFRIEKPDYVLNMEAAYGAPSQNGFGSAVFFEEIDQDEKLETASMQKYQYYMGDLWGRLGEEAWLSQWKEVYKRKAGLQHNIVAELHGISDPDLSNSVSMILSVVEDADAAKLALTNAYDDQNIVDLRVYHLGDGDAMSGLLIVGRRSNNETTFLVFVMD
jgi:hypothetical protein